MKDDLFEWFRKYANEVNHSAYDYGAGPMLLEVVTELEKHRPKAILLAPPPIPRTEREIRERMGEIAQRYRAEMERELGPYLKALATFPTAGRGS